jgi:hypothetical protein
MNVNHYELDYTILTSEEDGVQVEEKGTEGVQLLLHGAQRIHAELRAGFYLPKGLEKLLSGPVDVQLFVTDVSPRHGAIYLPDVPYAEVGGTQLHGPQLWGQPGMPSAQYASQQKFSPKRRLIESFYEKHGVWHMLQHLASATAEVEALPAEKRTMLAFHAALYGYVLRELLGSIPETRLSNVVVAEMQRNRGVRHVPADHAGADAVVLLQDPLCHGDTAALEYYSGHARELPAGVPLIAIKNPRSYAAR